MVKQKILADLKKVMGQLGFQLTDIVLSISKNPQFGDYSTNIPLQLAKQSSAVSYQSSDEIANEILKKFGKSEYLEKAEVVNGFINFFIKNEELVKNLAHAGKVEKTKKPQKILVEYGHANLLKEVHIGHLRTFILGESLCRILGSVGHRVFRANYQGDIGLHIAKAVWGIKKLGLPTKQLRLEEKAKFLGQAYAEGNNAYDADPGAKKEIDRINADLYLKKKDLQEVYHLTRNWSLEYFEPIYKLLGIKYDRCFFESEVYEEGKRTVSKNVGKVFEESDGAVIFPGEKYGLHNRVFVTSAGYSTYEGKEIGLAELEYKTFNYDDSIHVVASEQEDYFKVTFKSIEMIFPHLKGKKHHLSYGLVDLKEGKMSSRAGQVVTVDDLVKVISEKVRQVMKEARTIINQDIVNKVTMGAIKFSYLKYSPAPNIIFDLDQSVSLQGDSGPYVQYTYARIQSVLKKSKRVGKITNETLEVEERQILVQLLYFPEIVEEISRTYHPNLLASYLLELSRFYNLFYQKYRIIDSEKESFRLEISKSVGETLGKGLNLLGIEAPEEM